VDLRGGNTRMKFQRMKFLML